MKRKLEELLNLPEAYVDDHLIDNDTIRNRKTNLIDEATTIFNALSNSERIDAELTVVTGFHQHDDDMDNIAEKALKSYHDLCVLGQNVPTGQAARVYEVATLMLRTAMDAKDAKIQKKLRMVDLQIKKLRADKVTASDQDPRQDGEHNEFDRNALLKYISDASKAKTSN